jgi:hypothetical protein
LAALAIKPFYAYVDFGAFYATALGKILAGTPLDLYAFVAHPPGTDLAFPLTNPPVWFFYLAPWYALGRALGFDDLSRQAGVSYGQAWMLIASLPLDVLMCRTVVRLVEVQERIAEPRRWSLFLCLLLSPILWLSSVRFQHNEAAMVLFVLLAVWARERGGPGWSGLCWGLALGLKTTAVVPALAHFGWGLGRGRRRGTLLAAAVAGAVFLGPLLPYLVFRREQVMYALVGFERLRPLGGYGLWKLVPDPAALAAYPNVLIVSLAALLGLAMARCRGNSFLASGGGWALVLGQVLLLLFGKGLFIWYALALSVFLFLAAEYGNTAKPFLPVKPLVASILVWIALGSDWVGEANSLEIKIRSAIWVALLLGIGAMAVQGLTGAGAQSARRS